MAKTSKISKSIERVINIGSYQSVRVSVHVEEEIEYKTDDEFRLKSELLSRKVSKDLVETISVAQEELNIDSFEKKIFGKTKKTGVEVSDDIFDSLDEVKTSNK